MYGYVVVLLLSIVWAPLGIAQPVGGMPPRVRPTPGRVFGRVMDAYSKEVLEYATITIMPLQKDTILGGAMVKANGDFSVEKLPLGDLRIRISFIGYKPYTASVQITMKAPIIDLGNIRMEADISVLEDVVIEADRSTMIMAIDKRIFNVEKDLSSRGGTGIDIMKNIPGVTVDGDGNVQVRNQNPTVFIDGRPSTMTLEQIPAEQIEKVEIITNPSVKYDAGSTGGIVNVILKKNTKPGYNGMLSVGAGTHDRYNASGNFNIKEGKWNFGASYNYNQGNNPGKGYTDRLNYRNGETTGGFVQNTNQNFGRTFQFGRINADYQINNRSNLSWNLNSNLGRFRQLEHQDFYLFDSAFTQTSNGYRDNTVETGFSNYTTQLAYRYTFPGGKQELTTDITLNQGEQINESNFNTFPEGAGGLLNPELQWNTGGGNTRSLTWQLDYTATLADSGKIEAGLRTNIKDNETGQDVFFYRSDLGYFDRNASMSANYIIDDQIHAGYFNYLNRWRKWGYAAGLRYEQTIFRGELAEQNLRFEYLYPDGTKNLLKTLFPSLYITRDIGKGMEMQLNFSRKINRPGYRQIMPYIMFADRQSYSIGNPALAPEFINLGELNFSKSFKKATYFTSLYGRYTEDVISSFVYPLESDASVLVNTYINGEDSRNFGWEQSYKYNFTKSLEVTLSGNINYIEILANTGSEVLRNSGYTWNGKALLLYRIGKSWSVQANGDYESPRIQPQGKTIPVYAMDMSVNKDFNRKLSINFSVNDVFNTRRFGGIYETAFFRQEFSRRRQTRFFRVNLTWRFGEFDTSLFRRKSNSQRRDPGNSGGGDMEY